MDRIVTPEAAYGKLQELKQIWNHTTAFHKTAKFFGLTSSELSALFRGSDESDDIQGTLF
jgi:hypothetical protein